MSAQTVLQASKIKVSGPRIDGGFSVTFEVGEDQQENVSKLLLIPQNTLVTVKVEHD